MGTLILARPVIAVTGSSGKTTTKEMIAAILGQRWKVFKAKGNHNLVSATRAHAKMIKPEHQAVVLEYAMAAPGIIKLHCQVIRPNIGVITNVGTAHVGNFGGSVRKLAAAKSELIRYMDRQGTLVINGDDPGSRYLKTDAFGGKIITFGLNNAMVKGRAIKVTANGTEFEAWFGEEWHKIRLPFYGEHNVLNALAAICVAHHLGFSPGEIRQGLLKSYRTRRRLFLRRSPNGILVVDDSYSSNPHALRAALDVLVQLEGERKIAVLGEMLELGAYSVTGHREVGRYIAGKGLDLLLTLGRRARLIGEEAVACGLDSSRFRHFTNRADLHAYLKGHLRAGDIVLVKGSHLTEMHKTADYIARGFR